VICGDTERERVKRWDGIAKDGGSVSRECG